MRATVTPIITETTTGALFEKSLHDQGLAPECGGAFCNIGRAFSCFSDMLHWTNLCLLYVIRLFHQR